MNPVLKWLYQPYKWIIVVPLIFIFTMILGLVCILVSFIFKPDTANIVAVIWARLCCAIVPLTIRVKGRQNFKTNRSYIVVSNHQSMADIPVVHGFLGLNIKWIMKKELDGIPIFSSACRRLGCIYVDRTNPGAAIESIHSAQKNLSRKASVFFFAEGTRSRDGKVMPFKKGAFRFAFETGLPILPVTIKNSIDILPSDSLDMTPGKIDIIVHKPIKITDVRWEKIDQTIDDTRKTVADAL